MITTETINRIVGFTGNGLQVVSLYVRVPTDLSSRGAMVRSQIDSRLHEIRPMAEDHALGHVAMMSLRGPTEAYQLDVHGFASGPVSVEEASCTDQARMRLPGGDAHYVISLPVRGAVLTMYRGKELDLRPGQAVVFQPPAEAVMTTDDDFDVLVLRVDAAALEDAPEGQLGYPVRRPLPLAPTLDLDSAAGRGWATLLRYLVNAAVPGAPAGQPGDRQAAAKLAAGLVAAGDRPSVPGSAGRIRPVLGTTHGAPRRGHDRGFAAVAVDHSRACGRRG